ncbi:MAG: peroxiredoxin, partial [Ardenticatenaceae bacterium]
IRNTQYAIRNTQYAIRNTRYHYTKGFNMALIEVGTQAPDFTLVDQDNNKHTLSSYRGKPVVLLFYPLDFSPVCSDEMTCVMDNLTHFNDLDAQVFGISVDSRYAHKAFADHKGVTYPLLADFHPKGEVAKQYGIYLNDFGISSRGYIIVASDGTVSAAKDVKPFNMPDFDEIVAAVKASNA